MRLPDIRARMISLFPRRAGRLFRTVAPAFQFQLQFQVRLLKRDHYGGFIASVTWFYRRSVIPAKLVPDDEKWNRSHGAVSPRSHAWIILTIPRHMPVGAISPVRFN
jgi:hypothetical protein